MKTILVIVTLIFTVSSEEERPYLVIKTSNEPLLTSRIDVSHGQNLSLYCVVYPNHHSVLWQAKNKQIKSSDHIATLNIYNLRNSDLGTYNCESPSAHIRKIVDVVRKRKRRDVNFPQLPDDPNELIDFIIQEEKKKQYSNDNWDKYEKEREEFEVQREKRRRSNRNIGIAIGAVAFGSVLIGLLCVACRKCNQSTLPPTIPSHQQSRNNNTPQGLVNTYEISPLCRPIETSITPYPPERRTVSPSAPIAEPECPPPPSYEEVVSPSVPHWSAQNSAKM